MPGGTHPVSECLAGDDQIVQLAELLGRQGGAAGPSSLYATMRRLAWLVVTPIITAACFWGEAAFNDPSDYPHTVQLVYRHRHQLRAVLHARRLTDNAVREDISMLPKADILILRLQARARA